jgi:adenylosuccinate lyase
VDELSLSVVGKTGVRYADNRRAVRDKVKDVWLQMQGRVGTFKALVEPKRTDAMIGATVMENLDFVIDRVTQRVNQRDRKMVISEVE